MKKNAIFIYCLVFGIFFVAADSSGYPTAKVTARVVNEQGEPVPDADVSISFMKAKLKEWGMTTYDINGKSDKNGLFTASGGGVESVSIYVKKEEYYPSGAGVKLTTHNKLLNRWEPWNPTVEVVLKKKRNPVPMYMNNTNWATIPEMDSPIGYDLEKGDWVAPYGNGVIGDFLIRFISDYKGYRDYESRLIITFSNENDGIQEYIFDTNEQSYFKWPFEAPINGYLRKIEKFKSDRPGKGIQSNVKKDINYIFRVRTKTDGKGNIIEAKYGKIRGDFQVGRKPQFGIGYYFNPDGTRNLEEDPKQNLFKK